MSAPLYSLVLFGRNDDYNPDFVYRVQTTLNFSARSLSQLGKLDEVEFIVVDWGSVVPLRDVLALEEAACAVTSFLEVSVELAKQFASGQGGVPVTRATNVGIRRARGRFIGMQGADLLMSRSSWQALMLALADQPQSLVDLSKACLLVPRRQVPWSFVARQPDLETWERALLTCDKATSGYAESSPSTAGGMGIMVLHRDVWQEAKGLEESFSGYGYSDIDLGFRVGSYYPWIDAASYGVVCYKMQHDPQGRRGQLLKGGRILINSPWVTPTICSRTDEWGLPRVAIESKKALPKVEQHIALSTGRWNGRLSAVQPSDPNLFAESDIRHHARAALDRSYDFDETDWELLTVLSWFGLRKFPMNYLEVGLIDERCVRAVSTACPSVDIYVVEAVQQNSDGRAPRSAEVAMSLLWQWGHKGYFRPLIGEPADTLEQLAKSFIGPFEIELAVMNLGDEHQMELVPRILSTVVPGGLLAIRSKRAEWLTAALEISIPLIAEGAPIYVGDSGRTAFVFIPDKNTRPTEPVFHKGTRRELPPTGLPTMLCLRTTVFFREIQLAASRLCRLSRWPTYFRILVAEMSARR